MNIRSGLGNLLLFVVALNVMVMGSEDDHDHHDEHSESNLSDTERWGYSFIGSFIIFMAVFIPPILFQLVKKEQLMYFNSYFISFGAGAILAVLFVDLLEIVSHTIGITWKSMSVLLASYLVSLLFAFGIRTEDECCEGHHNNELDCTHDEHTHEVDHCTTKQRNVPNASLTDIAQNQGSANSTSSLQLQSIDLESPPPPDSVHSHKHIPTDDADEGAITQHNARHLSPIVIISDAFCNFVDGLLVVIAFSTCSAKIGWEVTGAILMHEIPHEIGDFAILIRAHSYKKSVFFNACSGLFSLVGCLVGNLIVKYYDSEELIGYILCVGIGGLMFVSTNVLPRAIKSKHRSEAMGKCFATLLGMAIVTALLSQHTECH